MKKYAVVVTRIAPIAFTLDEAKAYSLSQREQGLATEIIPWDEAVERSAAPQQDLTTLIEDESDDEPVTEIADYEGPFISTSLQGYVWISYDRIVERFGPPHESGPGLDKVDAEWTLMTPAGIATIYNYKDGKNYLGEGGLDVEEITDWHIGGTDSAVVKEIANALNAPHKVWP